MTAWWIMGGTGRILAFAALLVVTEACSPPSGGFGGAASEADSGDSDGNDVEAGSHVVVGPDSSVVDSSIGDGGIADADATADVGAAKASALDSAIEANADTSADAPLLEAEGGTVTGYAFVEFDVETSDSVIGLQTTLAVPAEPPPTGTLFLWPGLQSNRGDTDFDPIGNGVLQPVLTWGASCAPGTQPTPYSTWWVSAQYVNTMGSDPGYMGCDGGAVMSAAVGDTLLITMTLSGTVWQQTAIDQQRIAQVAFNENLLGQAQSRVEFVVEEYSAAPVSDVLFTNTTISYATSDPGHCALARRGQNDFVSAPQPSSDGMHCFIQEIILRAEGGGSQLNQ